MVGNQGIFVSIFTILGVIGGGVTVYRQIMEVIEDNSNERKKRDDGVR